MGLPCIISESISKEVDMGLNYNQFNTQEIKKSGRKKLKIIPIIISSRQGLKSFTIEKWLRYKKNSEQEDYYFIYRGE